MPLRLLLMVAGYVAICVAVFKFWPQTEGDVVVATQKTAPAAQVQPENPEPEQQVASTTQPEEPAQVQPAEPVNQGNADTAGDEVSSNVKSQERLISSADRMALLEVWTIIEECRLNRCESMNLSTVGLNFVPEEIKDLRRLNTLIVGKRVSDINALAGMRNIRILNLSGSKVVDISAVAALSGLKFLEIAKTEITDLSSLANLGAVEHIDFANSKVSDIDPIRDLINLRYLNASGSNLLDLEPMGTMFELQEVLLNDTQVLDLSYLSRLDKLRRVEAARTNISELPDLSTSEELEFLDVSETKVSDLTPLGAMENLTVLNISGTAVSDISQLASLGNLRELDLTDTRLTSLEPLNEMENLEIVYLSAVPPDSIDVLSALRSRGVSIEQQQTTGNQVNSDVGVEGAAEIKFLTGSNYAPFVGDDLPNGGFSTELIEKAMNVNETSEETTISVVSDWGAHLQPLLSGGAYDLGYPWFRPDCSQRDLLGEASQWRCDNLRFSKPLHDIVVSAYALNDTAEQIGQPADAVGKSICRPSGYFTHDLESMGLGEDNIKRLAPSTADECFEMLRDGKADLVVLNADVSDALIDKFNLGNEVSEILSMSSVQTLHAVGMRTNQRTRVLLRQLDLGLDALKKNGEFNRLMEKHL